MNNVKLLSLQQEREEKLKKYGIDQEKIEEFKSKIKKVSTEEKEKLGKELFELISKKGYNDKTEFEKVIELIYKGADIEYKDEKKGNFALLVCSRKNYVKTFIVLLKAGANINQVNNFLTTATMGSARHGNKEILEMLILMKADINARCLDGDNAIMSAKMHNQVECFNMLVKASAFLNNRNLANQTLSDLKGNAELDVSLLTSCMLSKKTTFEDTQDLLSEARIKMQSINNTGIH